MHDKTVADHHHRNNEVNMLYIDQPDQVLLNSSLPLSISLLLRLLHIYALPDLNMDPRFQLTSYSGWIFLRYPNQCDRRLAWWRHLPNRHKGGRLLGRSAGTECHILRRHKRQPECQFHGKHHLSRCCCDVALCADMVRGVS